MISRESLLSTLHLRDERCRRRARENFAQFVGYTKPNFRMGWFHAELCRLLDEFLPP